MIEIKKNNENNYLDYVPRRMIEHEVDDDGLFVLLRPRFMKGFFAKFVQPRIKAKYYKVRLDKFGSKTWEAIDGKRSVKEIADLLYSEFKDEVEPRYERCSTFISSLERGAMVGMQYED